MDTQKTCTKCHAVKPLAEFYPNKRARSGLCFWCKSCMQGSASERAAREPERYKKISREKASRYRKRHPEKIRAYKRSERGRRVEAGYRERNREVVRQRSVAWEKRNPDNVLARTRYYQAQKLNATPSWADREKMEWIYRRSRAMYLVTGVKHHVDHIVPLQSPIVCGLHVEHNLQVLPAVKNIKKGNRVWPDMPGRE